MPKTYLLYLMLCLCCYPMLSTAQVHIYKCITPQGHIIFNDSGCQGTTEQQTLSVAPTMTIPALPRSVIEAQLKPASTQPQAITVISDAKTPCGTFNPTQRRTDLIRLQVKSGMSRTEVDSMFGRALKERNHNGTISVTYPSPHGKQRNVRFNQQGCVP